MKTSTARTGKKHLPKTEGILETAAQAIGSALGSIAVRTGIAKPANPKRSTVGRKVSVRKSSSPAASLKTGRKGPAMKKRAVRIPK